MSEHAIRTFEHFPTDAVCPVCKTNEDDTCVLVGIDGTEDEHNIEAKPVHLACAVAQRFNESIGLLYTKI